MRKVEIACRDCRRCTNSAAANLGRGTGRATAALLTGGFSELGFALKKKCRTCDHQMSLHGYTATPQPTVNVQAPPSAPMPSPLVPARAAVGIADEIKKLVELRDAGVLNEQEFQAQKGKLLDVVGL